VQRTEKCFEVDGQLKTAFLAPTNCIGPSSAFSLLASLVISSKFKEYGTCLAFVLRRNINWKKKKGHLGDKRPNVHTWVARTVSYAVGHESCASQSKMG
jgi:hypothetical protein